MVATAVRCIACAGVLAAALFMGGLGNGIAIADPSDSASNGLDGAVASSNVDDNSGALGDRTPDQKPTTTVGSGREEINGAGSAKKLNASLPISIPRWPTPAQARQTGTSALMSSDLRLTPLSGQATRVGYPRDFRTPTIADLAALTVPGVVGLMFMTFGGSILGYRQANSLRFIRTQGAERFLR